MAKNKYSVGDIVLVKGRISEIDDSDEILDVEITTSENEFYINSGDIYSVVENKVTDPVKKPSHYQGRFGLEAIDVIKNFAASPEYEEGFYWGMPSSTCYAGTVRMDWKT